MIKYLLMMFAVLLCVAVNTDASAQSENCAATAVAASCSGSYEAAGSYSSGPIRGVIRRGIDRRQARRADRQERRASRREARHSSYGCSSATPVAASCSGTVVVTSCPTCGA